MLPFYEYAKSAQMAALLEQVKLVRKTMGESVRARSPIEQDYMTDVIAALARMKYVIEASQLDEV